MPVDDFKGNHWIPDCYLFWEWCWWTPAMPSAHSVQRISDDFTRSDHIGLKLSDRPAHFEKLTKPGVCHRSESGTCWNHEADISIRIPPTTEGRSSNTEAVPPAFADLFPTLKKFVCHEQSSSAFSFLLGQSLRQSDCCRFDKTSPSWNLACWLLCGKAESWPSVNWIRSPWIQSIHQKVAEGHSHFEFSFFFFPRKWLHQIKEFLEE